MGSSPQILDQIIFLIFLIHFAPRGTTNSLLLLNTQNRPTLTNIHALFLRKVQVTVFQHCYVHGTVLQCGCFYCFFKFHFMEFFEEKKIEFLQPYFYFVPSKSHILPMFDNLKPFFQQTEYIEEVRNVVVLAFLLKTD